MSDQSASRDFALEIVKRLRQAGYQALWAGGCVRDLMLGQTPADYDVATAATPEQVMAALPYPRDHGRDLVRRRPGSAFPARRRRSRGRDLPQRRCLCRRTSPGIGRLRLARARRRSPRLHDQRDVHGPALRRSDRLRRRARPT